MRNPPQAHWFRIVAVESLPNSSEASRWIMPDLARHYVHYVLFWNTQPFLENSWGVIYTNCLREIVFKTK